MYNTWMLNKLNSTYLQLGKGYVTTAVNSILDIILSFVIVFNTRNL